MYNPSNHIPLSKSMGPNAFPVDGKYMYFTNGQNSVYRYRPFQSTAEAIAYFPLGSSFRGSPEGQPWAFEILINEGGTLSVDGGYITGGINSVWWWRDGVLDADLIKKNGPTTSDIKQFPFTRADLTNVADGMGDLVLPFTGGQIAMGLISRSGITDDDIPTGDLVANLSGGPVTSYNQLPDVDQYGIVYYVGEAVEVPPFEATLTIDNQSSASVTYDTGSGTVFLASDNALHEDTIPGSSVTLDVALGQTCVYTVYDNAGGVVFTFTQVDAGTINGLPMTDDQSQEFIISNTPLNYMYLKNESGGEVVYTVDGIDHPTNNGDNIELTFPYTDTVKNVTILNNSGVTVYVYKQGELSNNFYLPNGDSQVTTYTFNLTDYINATI